MVVVFLRSASGSLDIVFSVLTSVGTVAAALFAAWTAWISRASANAAEHTVEEMRKARKANLSPRLVLERNFLDFYFVWPHADSLNGEPVFLARRHGQDKYPTPPTFSLSNYGAGAALEIEIVFEFEDPNGEYSVPETVRHLGIWCSEMLGSLDHRPIKTLQFARPGGGGVGLPLYSKWTTDIPHCAPGQTRSLEFPQALLSTLFLRGLQNGARYDELRRITLNVHMACRTVEGDPCSTQFRFKTFPYWYGTSNPINVYGHFYELPMYPKSSGDRAL